MTSANPLAAVAGARTVNSSSLQPAASRAAPKNKRRTLICVASVMRRICLYRSFVEVEVFAGVTIAPCDGVGAGALFVVADHLRKHLADAPESLGGGARLKQLLFDFDVQLHCGGDEKGEPFGVGRRHVG